MGGIIQNWSDDANAVADMEFIAAAREAVPALLDRIARLEAQTSIRGRAVVMYRERARQAEARIRDLTQDVQDERGAALDQMEQVQIRDARIKAVRDVHRKWTVGDPCDKRRGCGGADCAPHVNGHGDKVWRHWRDDCTGCAAAWPCPTIRALDGGA
ncbi:hypothetical protein [Brachybacterium massiliense]|uniref:hypothetical protein n=1 Tax=Brachybacterium massiliense TaxID=1755098 RepID=UPI000B3BD027|nr:hypothetical protein [Brachybacterium massiliense]